MCVCVYVACTRIYLTICSCIAPCRSAPFGTASLYTCTHAHHDTHPYVDSCLIYIVAKPMYLSSPRHLCSSRMEHGSQIEWALSRSHFSSGLARVHVLTRFPGPLGHFVELVICQVSSQSSGAARNLQGARTRGRIHCNAHVRAT